MTVSDVQWAHSIKQTWAICRVYLWDGWHGYDTCRLDA
ncbi:hypothetical protein MPQ_0379 [Methylovorus sp. MP688]|nr:hypothetical protein MPQ_0379 [Methylovorus sp. MP688]